MSREYFISELEWWDRVAMALELLERKPGTQQGVVTIGPESVAWVGNGVPPKPFVEGKTAEVTAYVFGEVRDAEILRRLNQMPDETPLDLLMEPFSFYCPEVRSFVSVNAPEVSLERHLEKLRSAS